MSHELAGSQDEVAGFVRKLADATEDEQAAGIAWLEDRKGKEIAAEVRERLAPKPVVVPLRRRDISAVLAQQKAKAEAEEAEHQAKVENLKKQYAAAKPEERKASAKPEPKPEPVALVAMPSQARLVFQHSRTPAGIPPSLENALKAVDTLGIECRYDVYHDKIIVKGHACEVNGDALENLDNVTLKVRQAVLGQFGFDPGAQHTFDGLRLRCLDRVFDPVRDYLEALTWDGRKRLDRWLIDYCGAADNALNRAIGRKMLIAGVRRVRSPGCKFDYIVVLEGRQGAGKSSLLKVMAGEENFSDNEIIGLDKREQQEAVQGVWIYEIAELEGLHKSDVTKIKMFASKTVDSARPAYARSRVDRPRRGVFVATTNEDTYLRDTTGNRRFWPVRVGTIDLAGVAADRDQLWAEAAVAETGGEPLVIPETLWPDAAAEQAARMEIDPWEDAICVRLAGLQRLGNFGEAWVRAADAAGEPEWRVASDFLLSDVLGIPKSSQNNNHTKRLAAVMRGLGWTHSPSPLRFGKVVKRGFVKEIEPEAGSGL